MSVSFMGIVIIFPILNKNTFLVTLDLFYTWALGTDGCMINNIL